MTKRLDFIDVARAIAIFLIVLGHTLVHSAHCGLVYKYIYSFHVPLFFILSGFVFKRKDIESYFTFFKNKFLRIMIPYFIWATLFLIPYFILGNAIGDALNIDSSYNLKDMLSNILYGNANGAALKQNSALWFLPSLFCAEIVSYFIVKLADKGYKQDFFLLLLLFLMSFICHRFLSFILPWGINTIYVSIPFFFIGYLLKKYNVFEREERKSHIFYLLLLFVIGSYASFNNYQTVTFIEFMYGNLLFTFISGIFLSIVLIAFSKKIRNKKWLQYIGKNTMGILIFHKIILVLFHTKLGKISEILMNSNLEFELILSLLITGISILFSLFITYIVNSFFPFSLGNKKKI